MPTYQLLLLLLTKETIRTLSLLQDVRRDEEIVYKVRTLDIVGEGVYVDGLV